MLRNAQTHVEATRHHGLWAIYGVSGLHPTSERAREVSKVRHTGPLRMAAESATAISGSGHRLCGDSEMLGGRSGRSGINQHASVLPDQRSQIRISDPKLGPKRFVVRVPSEPDGSPEAPLKLMTSTGDDVGARF